jgi:hypothetical protein
MQGILHLPLLHSNLHSKSGIFCHYRLIHRKGLKIQMRIQHNLSDKQIHEFCVNHRSAHSFKNPQLIVTVVNHESRVTQENHLLLCKLGTNYADDVINHEISVNGEVTVTLLSVPADVTVLPKSVIPQFLITYEYGE